jgi:hypothetical protein
MQLDEYLNEMFEPKEALWRFAAAMQETWRRTARSGFSVSDADLQNIEITHKAALSLVDEHFALISTQAKERQSNLIKYQAVKFISLGEDCLSRTVPTQWGLKPSARFGEKSCPFDLAVHPIHITSYLIEHGFEGYLETANLEFVEAAGYCFNSTLNVGFNHEVGRKYADDDFRLLTDVYNKRIQNFYRTIESEDKIVFIVHIQAPSEEKADQVERLWSILRSKWPTKQMLIVCVNTWPCGTQLDNTSVKNVPEAGINVLNIRYPWEGYVWHYVHHCFSPLGYQFEKELIDGIKRAVDGWIIADTPSYV